MMPTGKSDCDEMTGECVEITEEMITVSAVEPLEPTVEITVYSEEDIEAEPTIETIENPEITQDNLERTEAQAVVESTPSEVVTTYMENK
jgi:hypothetical protein